MGSNQNKHLELNLSEQQPNQKWNIKKKTSTCILPCKVHFATTRQVENQWSNMTILKRMEFNEWQQSNDRSLALWTIKQNSESAIHFVWKKTPSCKGFEMRKQQSHTAPTTGICFRNTSMGKSFWPSKHMKEHSSQAQPVLNETKQMKCQWLHTRDKEVTNAAHVQCFHFLFLKPMWLHEKIKARNCNVVWICALSKAWLSVWWHAFMGLNCCQAELGSHSDLA